MATTLTPFPTVPPMPFMPPPPSPDELHKTIRSTVESTIIDVMNNPSSELGNIIKKHVKESMECKEVMDKLSKKVHNHMHNIEDKDDEKSDLEFLFCEIVSLKKSKNNGINILRKENPYSKLKVKSAKNIRI